MRRLRDSVVVITGASSGIGRATALAFAERGAAVVVAARRREPLAGLVRECEERGGRALAVPVDTTDEQAVRDLARRAAEAFGRIDVWVNNAAVYLLARLEDAPMAEVRRVVDTNLFGYLYGIRAALPYMRDQGGGVLINNASMFGVLAAPYVGAYAIAKHGVRGMGMTLRQELALSGAKGVHVCTVMPATIDTPFFAHTGNLTGRVAKAFPPVYPPERVARTIVNLTRFPRREVYVGNAARIMAYQYRMAPGLTERMLAEMAERAHFAGDRAQEPTSGNLFEPMPEGTRADGGWEGRRRVVVRRALTAAGCAAATAALLATRRRAA